ncbi:alpha/beta fold hydrolase [soil metagenome]
MRASQRGGWKRLADFPEPRFFQSFDGTQIAWRELGEGRPVMLIHGYFSNAVTNWIRYGHAAKIAAKGYRVIMPDLRAHGDSAKPHEAAAYPKDALEKDGQALIAHLGLTDYDLGGYSLGARTVARMLTNDANPTRVIFSGMGLSGLIATGKRAEHFAYILDNLGTHAQGSPEWLAEAFLKTTKGDPIALKLVLSTFASTPIEAIRAIQQPALVVCGAEDADNGSALELAETLPNGRYVAVPGGHMSAVIKPELGQAMSDFLAA